MNEYVFMPAEKDREKAGRQMTQIIVQAMRSQGIQPQLIYAFYKCGFMITEGTKKAFPKSDIKLWEEAIKEYNSGEGLIPF